MADKKNKGGRPRKISSPEEMDKLVDDYVKQCNDQKEPVTLTGMIMALDLCSRSALDEYGKRPEFLYSVKRCKNIVAHEYEKKLSTTTPTGPIFALKNMGWSDKIQQEITGKDGGPIEITGIDLKFIDAPKRVED